MTAERRGRARAGPEWDAAAAAQAAGQSDWDFTGKIKILQQRFIGSKPLFNSADGTFILCRLIYL